MLALGLTAGVRVIEQTGNSLTVEFLIDDYELIESEDYTRVILTGAGYPEQSGAPSLPSYEFKIGVPPDGDLCRAVVKQSGKTHIPLPSIHPNCHPPLQLRRDEPD
jgi:hypothetical protein